ncbi:MAG: AAA family ATPase [Deltaproteobacteria bacterium]|nr:AAA family ATPase [Deltaproteobacteria bacterium]
MSRYLSPFIVEDLKEKMVFVGGPRQVGKTTMALSFLKNGNEEHPAYLNWDLSDIRPKLIRGYFPPHEKLIIFDEIHKYKGWRNLLKGFYDRYKKRVSFLVTGSARLDYYRKGGDALQGRYHFHRLHPFSLNEFAKNPSTKDLEHLLTFGGFP